MKDKYRRKQAWAVIANGDESTVMEMLHDRSQQSIEAFLKGLKSPDNIKVVTMDAHSGYRAAVRSVLPWAKKINTANMSMIISPPLKITASLLMRFWRLRGRAFIVKMLLCEYSRIQ